MTQDSGMLRFNLHNHTLFSDGKHTISALIEQAIGSGIKLLGISDHSGTTKTTSLPLNRLPEYVRLIRTHAERYMSEIKILAGIELDSCINRTPELHQLPYDQINSMDYVLFEYINNPYWNGLDLQQLGYIRRKIGIPVGLAHPDIGFLCENMPVGEVIDFLEHHAIFLELTSRDPSKYRNYPDFFQRLKDRQILLSIGSDTHDDILDIARLEDPIDFITSQGLQDQLISKVLLRTCRDILRLSHCTNSPSRVGQSPVPGLP